MWDTIIATILQTLVTAKTVSIVSPVVPREVLARHEFSLEKRYADAWVNRVFKENILLTLAYGRKLVSAGKPVDWNQVDKPFRWSLELPAGKVLTYHDTVLPKYQGEAMPLTNVYFNSAEGFLSDGWLVGDGTCQLASLLGWVARDAGLSVEAPTNHNFAAIADVPKEQGVAIYHVPSNPAASARQNLYIQNNKGAPVQFVFDYDGITLRISAEKLL